MCFFERRVHFPHPPSPSKGIGCEYASFLFDLDAFLEGDSRDWMGVIIRFVNVVRNDLDVAAVPPALPPATLTVLNNFGTKLTPTAKINAINAVLNTSDNNTARKDDHTPFEDGAR